jgi:hypothetical protein
VNIRYDETTENQQSCRKLGKIPVFWSRIIFMQLWVKILMRLRLLPFCIARQFFLNELKFKHMLKLFCSFDSVPVRFILLKIRTAWVINCSRTFCVIFQFLTMFNTILGAGAASRYGSDQIMRLCFQTLENSPPDLLVALYMTFTLESNSYFLFRTNRWSRLAECVISLKSPS